jgi:hypothetical protein
MPSCSRCLQDDKPCFYAKSRRGMRDRNAPKKRASLKEQEQGRPFLGGHNIYGDSLSSSAANYTFSAHSSEASTSPPSSMMSANASAIGVEKDPRRLVELYYRYGSPVI